MKLKGGLLLWLKKYLNHNMESTGKIAVLQLIDNLGYGGAENMAVQIANTIAESNQVASFICATREGGVYEQHLRTDVQKLILNKKKFFDFKALKKLHSFIVLNNIKVIQAHSSSIFWALLIKIRHSKCKIIWHNHYGMSEFAFSWRYKLRNLPVKLLNRLISHYLVVNEVLLQWNKKFLEIPDDKSQLLFNYPVKKELTLGFVPPTNPSKTILCLANIREQKGHPFLIAAINMVFDKKKDWSLVLVGKDFGGQPLADLLTCIDNSPFKDRIFWMGGQPNVGDFLSNAAIGVLSSKSEGLPVALLEYGLYTLPVVATNVGQVADVLGNYGIIVQYGDQEAFAEALVKLIDQQDFRIELAKKFQDRVQQVYSEEAAKSKLLAIYHQVIS